MQFQLKQICFIFLCCLILSGCYNPRKLITDEIVYKDGNSKTGTIILCDSQNVKIKTMDESQITIPWDNIDTIHGKKLKTFWIGTNFGYYNIPYFSVFKNEDVVGNQYGFQHKIGMAYRGNKLYYANLTYSPAKPHEITKFGFGLQYYLGESSYIKKTGFFTGVELNFMNAKMNNGSQTTFEPFTGYDLKLSSQLRLNFKFQLQINIANKNNQTGFNTTIGLHYLRRNFKRYYHLLNTEHKIPRK